MTISNEAAAVLEALRANVESTRTAGESHTAAGTRLGTVYLDNARPSDMSRHSFAGYLSALEAAGLYWPHGEDGNFGDVAL